MKVVLDTSALLALVLKEPGADRVAQSVPDSVICAVNAAEFVSVLADKGVPRGELGTMIAGTGIEIIPFDTDQAIVSGSLRLATKSLGLSLGDRSCLALAQQLDALVLTADKAWARLEIEIKIELIR